MLIARDHINDAALTALGAEAVHLLCSGQLARLVQQFGYALAFDREPVAALEEDVRACLAETHALSFVAKAKTGAISVKYFKPNDANLLAAVECDVDTDNGAKAQVELIVTCSGSEVHVTLEQISTRRVDGA